MKKAAQISVIFMMMLFWTDFSLALKQGTINESPFSITMIRYEVIVHFAKDMGQITCPLVVTVTDPEGNLIAPPQSFIPGRDIYNFFERGPVTGGRVAHIYIAPGFEGGTCVPVSGTDSKKGIFENGKTYKFNLYPPSVSAVPKTL